jgi:16S rRNA (uracil1498-N3)-methyltransferase
VAFSCFLKLKNYNKKMHRFFLKNFKQKGEEIEIFDSKKVHQIRNVLRLKPGNEIIIFNSKGEEFLIILESVNQTITGKILKEIKRKLEPKIKINLFQALLKKDNFEWFLKEGASLGINKFIPLITERTIVRQLSLEKLNRWQRIIEEAIELSGLTKIPEILNPVDFKSLKKEDLKDALNLIAHHEEKKSLKKILPKYKVKEINLFIGPEGGFSKEEIKFGKKIGLIPFRFCPSILRAEFAGLAIASAIFYYYS